MPVTFSNEPTIHNLEDAPPPAPEMLASSPLSSPTISSPRHLDIARRAVRLPSPPLSAELDDQSVEEESSSLNLASLDASQNMESALSPKDDEVGSDKGADEGDDGSDREPPIPEESPPPPLKLFGYTLPGFLQKRTSWNRVAASVVRYAPCFWCMARGQTGITDRNILYRLNILCAFFAFGQITAGVLLLLALLAGGVVSESDATGRSETNAFSPNLWGSDGIIIAIGFVGLVLFLTSILTLSVIKEVRMAGSLRYMWVLLWILPLEVFFVIALFDYHRATDVWVKHWWYVPAFVWFRDRLCAGDTGRTKCVVPICGLPLFGKEVATLPYQGTDSEECIQGELAWCNDFYNATDCRAIRNDAQNSMERVSYLFSATSIVWGVLLILLLLLTINTLESIITKPIVQKAKESNVPGWLTLPIIFSTVAGAIMLFSPSSVLNTNNEASHTWVGIVFMSTGGLFMLAALWGWMLSVFTIMSNRDKRTKQVVAMLFIATLILTLIAIAVIFSLSIFYSVDVFDVGLTTDERGEIACELDTVESCSFCDESAVEAGAEVECPEWTEDDVTRVIRTQLKQSAALAAILSLFAFSALRFGFVLRRHIIQYEIDYV